MTFITLTLMSIAGYDGDITLWVRNGQTITINRTTIITCKNLVGAADITITTGDSSFRGNAYKHYVAEGACSSIIK